MWGLQQTPYVGANIPTSGAFVGQLIQVYNAAVPGGRSILRWTGTIWAPPAGELIAGQWALSNVTPVASVTPGVLTQTQIWQSPVIPDYMIPPSLSMELRSMVGVYSNSGVAGCVIGLALAGSVPVAPIDTQPYNYTTSFSVTPNANGVGQSQTFNLAPLARNNNAGDTGMYHSNGGTGKLMRNGAGAFVSGAMRMRLVVKPSGVGDQFNFDGYSLISMGAL